MHEFETYLDQLRVGLHVGPRRSEEICAEVRTHLDARVLQHEASGLSHDQAVAKATESFGDPKELAPSLVRANVQHHRAQALRSLAVGMLFGIPLIFLLTVIDYVAKGDSVAGALYWGWRNVNGSIVIGAIFGGLLGLAMGHWQARLRWLLGALLAAPIFVLAIWLYLRLHWGASIATTVVNDGCFDLREVPAFVLGLAFTMVVLAWATHRFVLRRPKPRLPAE